jgi:hypothetical protein
MRKRSTAARPHNSCCLSVAVSAAASCLRDPEEDGFVLLDYEEEEHAALLHDYRTHIFYL